MTASARPAPGQPGWLTRLRASDDGFTLIEVMAAIVVFALVAAAIVAMLIGSVGISRTNRQRVVAADLAAKDLETTRNALKSGVSLPIGKTSSTQTVGETTYTVTRTTSWTSLGQSGDSCSGGLSGTVAYQRVKVAVSWTRMNGIPPVTSDTVVTPPGGQLTPNAITIPVKVVDRDGKALADKTVTTTPSAGGTSQSQVTDDNGCAVFAQLTPALYNINVNTPGYVDWQGVQNHTESGGQTTPGTAPVKTISYDVPGTLTMAPTAVSGFPIPSTPLKYTVFHTKWSSPGTRQLTGVSGTSQATLTPAFPFATDVYSAWAGTCSDSQPASPTTGLVSPSTTTAMSGGPKVAPAWVTFTKANVPIKGATVLAKDLTGGCTDQYNLQGVTDAVSGTIKFSLPYGSWQFVVTSVSPAATYTSASSAVVLSPSTITPTAATTVNFP